MRIRYMQIKEFEYFLRKPTLLTLPQSNLARTQRSIVVFVCVCVCVNLSNTTEPHMPLFLSSFKKETCTKGQVTLTPFNAILLRRWKSRYFSLVQEDYALLSSIAC